MTIRILVIEDDVMLAHFIRQMLNNSNDYDADLAHSAEDGQRLFDAGEYQMVLLDLSLPDKDGFLVLRHILATSNTPTIVISSREDDASRIAALAQGADDYLTKPFHPQELLLRISKRLKNQAPQTSSSSEQTLTIPDSLLMLDLGRKLCLADGQPLLLTSAELNLLIALTKAKGNLVSHDQLTDTIRDFDVDETTQRSSVGSLPVLVHRLRKKLRGFHAGESLILTLPRQGYRLNRFIP